MEKDRKQKEEQQKATKEAIILNEKEQLRLEHEKREEVKVVSEASYSKNDESHLKGHAYEDEKEDNEIEEGCNDLREVTVHDYV